MSFRPCERVTCETKAATRRSTRWPGPWGLRRLRWRKPGAAQAAASTCRPRIWVPPRASVVAAAGWPFRRTYAQFARTASRQTEVKTIADGLGQKPAPSMLSSTLLLGLFGPPLRKRGSLSCGSSIFGNRRLCLTAVHNLDSIYSWVTTQDGESIRYMFLLTEQIRFFRVHPCS